MSQVFTYTFDTPTFKGTSKVNTGLFINGKFVDPIEGGSIECVCSSFYLLCIDLHTSLPGLLIQVRRVRFS